MKLQNILILTILTLILSGCGTSTSVSEADNVTINNQITNVDASNVDTSRNTLVVSSLFDKCLGGEFGDDCYVIHKFGHSDNIGTSITPITEGNIYQTPTSLTSLEILSSSVLDTSTGTGARRIIVQGLSTNWTEIKEIIIMNGTTPVQLSNQFYRVYRISLLESGTYANQIAGSHSGTITLRESGAGITWGLIALNTFPLGQSEIGVVTTPRGYSSYIGNIFMHVEGNKEASIYFFQRTGANITTAPYDPIRIILQVHGVTDSVLFNPKSLQGPFPPITDIGFMAYTSTGTTEAGVDFEILLLKDSVYGG